MLMPIVSMNKMAMNESVAATCCFHEVASPTNVYWEVLHGGWIGSGYVNVLGRWNSSYESWEALGYDLKMTGLTETSHPGLPKLTKDHDGKWVVDDNFQHPECDAYGYLDLYEWFSEYGARPGDACTHKDATCLYKHEEVQHLSNRHWESTSAHKTGGDGWKGPHEAKQFNS